MHQLYKDNWWTLITGRLLSVVLISVLATRVSVLLSRPAGGGRARSCYIWGAKGAKTCERQQPQRKHGDARECGSCLSPGRTHCFLPVSRTQAGCQPASEDLLHLHIHGQQWVNVVVRERLAFEPAPSEVSVSTGVTWQLTAYVC